MRPLSLVVLSLAGRTVLGHGDHGEDHGQQPLVAGDANWMTTHMAEEHHISDFDAASFFTLHDYDADGNWEPLEIQRTYGLMDESNKHITPERRAEISREVMGMLDANGDGRVDQDEFKRFIAEGNTLPDVGTGPGHHGDDEYEYEIHHWEKYHDENTKLEDLTHPEDIEHFKKHEQMEEEEERQEAMVKQAVVEENIPLKFRRDRS
ncbi:hypothetical protein CONLIGDRAFT_634069 [Coniochaeta ligniaria NRRL 30616]|uniref:EF-hand domain-containing protein n=1 Tax=Coniochaeta ligniaria NRRL 30616 TaxID=1408157 RepID=A0A1J7J363_9PEZI|nr:hypothetical protein CONLIGDRAFT_634069 [Coniochaeta ligniaria NRRL 30616]